MTEPSNWTAATEPRCQWCGETRMLEEKRGVWFCQVCAKETPKLPQLPRRQGSWTPG